jgi:hypothetical protein
MEGKIITHWSQIVGERFARLALPEKITFPQGKKGDGTLHLSVTSSGSLLVHFSQELILELVNTFFGYKALAKLRMTHGFVPPEEIPVQVPKTLSEEEKNWLQDLTSQVSDPELKERLESLGHAVSLHS